MKGTASISKLSVAALGERIKLETVSIKDNHWTRVELRKEGQEIGLAGKIWQPLLDEKPCIVRHIQLIATQEGR